MDIMLVIMGVVTTLSLVSLILKDINHNKVTKAYQDERRDLMNRIMAKNLQEYQSINDNTLPKGNNHLEKKFEGLYE